MWAHMLSILIVTWIDVFFVAFGLLLILLYSFLLINHISLSWASPILHVCEILKRLSLQGGLMMRFTSTAVVKLVLADLKMIIASCILRLIA